MASKKRTVLTIQEQYELIRKNEQKPPKTQVQLAKEYNISQSAVCKIIQRKQEIIQRYETTAYPHQKRIRPQPFFEINEQVFELFF